MAEWSIRSDEVCQRLLSELERPTGKGTEIHIIDSSTQTKRDDEYLQFEFIEDCGRVSPAATAFSDVRSSPARSSSIPSVRSKLAAA